jgi:hypothetical protein
VYELKAVRWRRYGKDRLYVNGYDGREVGSVDLLTGERTLSDPECEQAFTTTVNNWYVKAATAAAPDDSASALVTVPTIDVPIEQTATTSGEPQPMSTELSTPEQVSMPWHDLATHVAGQAARDQALRKLAAMKERTKVGTFLARAFDMKTDERAWRVGANGEETVGGRLEKLTKCGWHVLHAVPVGTRGSDIDHVVIGPGGVYTVNTRNHPGGKVWVASRAIRVNGQPVPYLKNSRHEGDRAEQLLSRAVGFPVPVRPVLVFLTGTLMPNVTIRQRPEDVLILDRTDIPGPFKRARQRLTSDQITAVFEVARRCPTWTGVQSCSCAGSR